MHVYNTHNVYTREKTHIEMHTLALATHGYNCTHPYGMNACTIQTVTHSSAGKNDLMAKRHIWFWETIVSKTVHMFICFFFCMLLLLWTYEYNICTGLKKKKNLHRNLFVHTAYINLCWVCGNERTYVQPYLSEKFQAIFTIQNHIVPLNGGDCACVCVCLSVRVNVDIYCLGEWH